MDHPGGNGRPRPHRPTFAPPAPVRPGPVELGGGRCQVHGDDTGGAFSVWASELPPRAGAPLHVHAHEDEAVFGARDRDEDVPEIVG